MPNASALLCSLVYGSHSSRITDDLASLVDVEAQVFSLVEDGDRSQGDYNDVYEGTVIVSGEYAYSPNDSFFTLTFSLDDESAKLVPQGELFNRRFFFENFEEAKIALGDNTAQAEECDVNTGTATIKISGYNSNLVQGEAMDSTSLVEVIKNSGPICAFD